MRRRVPLRIGPAPEPPPKPKPFTVLAKPRLVPPGLPSDLMAWYTRHEGVGIEGSAIHAVKLCKLAELLQVGESELAGPGSKSVDPLYSGFRGLRIAVGISNTPIIYVLGGKLYRFGTVFAIEASGRFILDANHIGWMARLQRDDWVEWGLARDRWGELQRGKHESLKRHFARINASAGQTERHPDPPGPKNPAAQEILPAAGPIPPSPPDETTGLR